MALDINTINRLSVPKKIIILFVISGIISAVYFFVFYKKLEEKLEKQKGHLDKILSERASLKAIADDLENYKEQVEKLKIRFKEALQQLPDSKEIDSLLSNVNKKGEESGLDFILFKPLPEVSKGFYAEVPVKVVVTGTYLDVATFFYKISNLKRIVNITNITMTNPVEINGKISLNTSCVATTFKFLKQSETEAAKPKTK
jgi:type IV pilus assembly protein PilO